MSYKLRVPQGGYVNIGLPTRTGRKFVFEFELTPENINSRIHFLSSLGSNSNHRFYFRKESGSDSVSIFVNNFNTTNTTFNPGSVWVIGTNVVEIFIAFTTDSPYKIVVNGVSSSVLNAVSVFQNEYDLFAAFGFFSAQYSSSISGLNAVVDVNNIKVYNWSSSSDTTGALVFNYGPSASNGTGLILYDTQGGQDGTLVNFPTDDSQWIYVPSELETSFELLGTLEVPDLGVGVTSTNTTLLIKAASLNAYIQSKLKEDWGDFRLSRDATGHNQLPLDILQNGLARTVLSNVVAGDLIRIWGNNPTAVKEIDTAPFGKHAVYQDKVFNLELANTSGNPVDSSGNSSDWTYSGTGTQTYGVEGVTLSSAKMLRSQAVTSLITTDNTYHLKFRANITAIGNNGVLYNTGFASVQRKDSGSQAKIQFSNGIQATGNGYPEALLGGTGFCNFDLVYDGGAHRLYRDGVQVWAFGYSVNIDWQTAVLFMFNNMSLTLHSISFSNSSASPEQVKIESDNANSNWWITDDVGGGDVISFDSVTASAGVFDGLVRLPVGFDSQTVSVGDFAGVARLSASFTSSSVSVSAFDGVGRLIAGFVSETASAGAFGGITRLLAGFASNTASAGEFVASISGTVSFESVTVSAGTFDSVVRLPAGFASESVAAGEFEAVTRLLAGFAGTTASVGVFDGLVRLSASFVSETLSESGYIATIAGQTNPSKPIRVVAVLNDVRVDVQIGKVRVATNVGPSRVLVS